jgi:diguanylate cyclase (GGDEF)-like protein
MIDIDHFKNSTTTSVTTGAMRPVPWARSETTRGSDIACRYGGEEFMLILSPSTVDGARHRAETIREAAKLLSVSHANQDLGAITLSLGVAIFPDHGSDAASIAKAADVALYQAKCAGRDQVVMFAQKTEQIPLQGS